MLCSIAFPAAAQQFDISPKEPVLLGEPILVQLRNLPADQLIKITAQRVLADEQTGKPILNRSEATFLVPADGVIDLARVAPKSGSYKGVDARGLFWSMQPSKESVASDRRSMEFRLEASSVADGKAVAAATINLLNALPNVQTESVNQFPGSLFASQRPSVATPKRPVIILLGGSEGGTEVTKGAARLASYGFAVLALPYYSPMDWETKKAELPALPSTFTDIPIERLNAARAWLQTRGDVDSTRIALFGTSKGAEFALLAGVQFSWITSIVAVVPSDVVWEGWGDNSPAGTRSSFALNGKPFTFVPYADFGKELAGFQTGDAVLIRRPHDKGRTANPLTATNARIPVEKIKGPVLVIAGHDDQLWNSGMMAQNIAERRASVGLDTVSLVYSDAGHFVGGNGYSPTTQYNNGLSKVGGTPEGNARAQADAWPKTLAFLRRTLGIN